MSRSSSARAAHLYAESAALDVVSARLDSLQRECDEADDALRRAQQRADDLLTQRTLLNKRQKDLQDSVHTARAAYTQEFLDSCPEEILRAIFEAVADFPDLCWCEFGDGDYNRSRAEDPFILSAVCARWRRVALRCPRIWTYVGLPPPKSIDRHPARIDLLLTRSYPHSLDIISGYEWSDCDDEDATTAFGQCIAKISLHSARWHLAELWLPWLESLTPWQPLVEALKGPLPLLRRLSLSSDELKLPSLALSRGESYLPFAPRLQELEIAIGGLNISETYHCGLPSLLSLRTWEFCSADNVARIIRLAHSTLSRLDICGLVHNASFPVKLPNLGMLYLASSHLSSAWSDPSQLLPRLEKLVIECSIVSQAFSTLFHGLSTVTYLGLFGPVTSEAIDVLRALSGITHLAFVAHIPAADDDSNRCTLRDNIFAHIADADPPIWPRLTSVAVHRDTVTMSGTLEGVLGLIKKRNVQADPSPAIPATEQRPVRLSEVVLECEQAPAWLKTEVARLLS